MGMTRFNIPLEEGVEMVFWALEHALGGEILVPKIPSYRIMDVAEAIGPNCEKKVIGIRPGEKIHEEMISASDSFFTYDLGKYYVIIPQSTVWNLNEFVLKFNAIKVKEGFSYNSLDNEKMENVESLRELIREHIDPNFKA